MILTDFQITEAYKNGGIVINPFSEDQVQPASYDFRVGEEVVTTSSSKKINIEKDGFIVLKPGDFAIFVTHEEIKLAPNYVARFGLRSSFARKGLIATTGPQIDPGYHGRLIIGVTNLTPQPITVSHLSKFISLEFHELSQNVMKPYEGRYQGRMGLTEEEINIVSEKNGIPLVKMLDSIEQVDKEIHAQSAKIDAQSKNISMMQWAIGIGFTVLIILLAFISFQIKINNNNVTNNEEKIEKVSKHNE